jgi:hypothetical protein
MTLLRRTCRQAAALVIAREDRSLSLPDSVALKLHLLACKACPKFENQVLTMRVAMGHWRNYSGDSDLTASRPASSPSNDIR